MERLERGKLKNNIAIARDKPCHCHHYLILRERERGMERMSLIISEVFTIVATMWRIGNKEEKRKWK